MRLANTGFARQQHHAAFALYRLLPAAQQQLDIFFTAEQRTQTATPVLCLKAAYHSAYTQHLPRPDRFRYAFKRDTTKITVFEVPGRDLTCTRGDHDRSGLGKSLQARGEVRRV